MWSALKADQSAALLAQQLSPWAKEYRGVFHRHSRTTKVRCQRAAWYIRQWVLGDIGLLESYKIPRGIVLDRDLSKVHPYEP